MLALMNDLPAHVVGVRATGEITREDFDRVLIPSIDSLVERTGKINYLLLLDTDIKNFTLGAWMKDALVGLKHYTQWNRIAIVSDSDLIKKFSDAFRMAIPGESKGFARAELETAKAWVAA